MKKALLTSHYFYEDDEQDRPESIKQEEAETFFYQMYQPELEKCQGTPLFCEILCSSDDRGEIWKIAGNVIYQMECSWQDKDYQIICCHVRLIEMVLWRLSKLKGPCLLDAMPSFGPPLKEGEGIEIGCDQSGELRYFKVFRVFQPE